MTRFSKRYLIIVGAVLCAWAIAGLAVMPWIIRAAYFERSLPFINAIIGGRDAHGVDRYLALGRTAFYAGSMVLIVGAAVLYLVLRNRRWLGMQARQLFGGDRTGTLSAGEAIVVSVAFGLFAGWTEAAGVLVKVLGGGLPNWGAGYSAEVVWMAPLASALLFAAVTAPVVLLLAALGRRLPIRILIAVLALFAFYGIFRSFRVGFHPAALLVLGVGIAVQLVRVAEKHPAGLRRLARRWIVASAAIAGIAGIAIAVASRSRPATGSARAGSANVLFIILDTVRAASLGLYGHDRPTTPNLDRFASRALVFDRALSTAPWTLPSHASFFTGRLPHELSVDWDVPLDDEYPTLAEMLAAQGYSTGGFIGNEFYTARRSGLDRGFQTYRDQPVSLDMIVSNSWAVRRVIAFFQGRADIIPPWDVWGRKKAATVNREFLDWLTTVDGRPFFAFLNYMDAHHPYRSPAPYDTAFSGYRIPVRIDWNDRYSREELQTYEVAYDQTIRYIDAQLGELFESLDRQGVLENTLVVIASDHGEQFGERTLKDIQHGRNLYLSVLHVPLIIALPGAGRRAGRIEDPVSLRDLPATVLDVLGIAGDRLPGESLARHWSDTNGPALTAVADPGTAVSDTSAAAARFDATIPSEIRRLNPSEGAAETWAEAMRSLLAADFHYIRNGDGSEELYDVRVDPWERTAMTGAMAETLLERFRGALGNSFPDDPRVTPPVARGPDR